MPPLFLFYDSNSYQGNQIEELKKVVKNIQNSTMGVLPRATKEALEFWSQDLGAQAADTFLKALDRFDQHIARALLVPTLIGMGGGDDAGKTGSLARSQQHADSFLHVVGQLQQDVAETVINAQVIKQLCDLNFPGLQSYPRFRFLPFDNEKKIEIMTAWASLVGGKIVGRIEDDEVHIRKVMGFPENEDVKIEELPADAANKAKMEAAKQGIDPTALDGGGKPPFGKQPPFGKGNGEDEETGEKKPLFGKKFEQEGAVEVPEDEQTEEMRTFAEENDAVWVQVGEERVAVNAVGWEART